MEEVFKTRKGLRIAIPPISPGKNKSRKPMKKMTCKQLEELIIKSFVPGLSKKWQNSAKITAPKCARKETRLMAAMDEMRGMMKSPEAMGKWFENIGQKFKTLPEEQS